MATEVKVSELESVSGGAGNSYFQYTVKKGDTLGKIAKRFGTTIEKIMALNPIITNKNLIKIGWVLLIPVK